MNTNLLNPSNKSQEQIQNIGQNLMIGAIRISWIYFMIFCVVMIGLNLGRNFFSVNIDDSDKSGWERSGLRIHIDNKTGVEYLSDGNGGLIVRANNEINNKTDKEITALIVKSMEKSIKSATNIYYDNNIHYFK